MAARPTTVTRGWDFHSSPSPDNHSRVDGETSSNNTKPCVNEAAVTSANGGDVRLKQSDFMHLSRPELEIGPFVSAETVNAIFSLSKNEPTTGLLGVETRLTKQKEPIISHLNQDRYDTNAWNIQSSNFSDVNSSALTDTVHEFDINNVHSGTRDLDIIETNPVTEHYVSVDSRDRKDLNTNEPDLIVKQCSGDESVSDLSRTFKSGRYNDDTPRRSRGLGMENQDKNSSNHCENHTSSLRTDSNGAALFSADIEEHYIGDVDIWHCHGKKREEGDNLARNQLIAVCVLCTTFMIGEAVGGVLSNSLALFTDVLHLGSDLISFFISLLAIYLSRKPATRTMSFGYYRAEVLGALFSVFIIWLVTGVLCYMAVERIMREHYKNVKADEMLITASLGVVFNIVMGIALHSEKCCGSAQPSFGHGHSHSHKGHSHSNSSANSHNSHMYEPLLDNDTEMISPVGDQVDMTHHKHHRHKNINVRAAFIHVIGDIIQSIGVLIASLIIKFKPEEEYKLADPICTFLFSILVIITTLAVLRDTLRIMMEGVPQDVDYRIIVNDLKGIEGVKSVHSLCIWCLTLGKNAVSVHIAVDENQCHQAVLEAANSCLKENHNFFQTTIQVENYTPALMQDCDNCKGPKL